MAQVRVRLGDPGEKMSRIFVDVWHGSWERVGHALGWAAPNKTRWLVGRWEFRSGHTEFNMPMRNPCGDATPTT